MGINGCGDALCVKCVIAELPIVTRPLADPYRQDWTGCDGQPATLEQLLALLPPVGQRAGV